LFLMQTISSEIEDGWVTKLFEVLKQFPKDSIKITDSQSHSTVERYTKSVIVYTPQEVNKRLTTAKENISKGHSLHEDTFWSKVDNHLETL